VAFGPFGEVLLVVRPDGGLTQYDAFGGHFLGLGVTSASVAFDSDGTEVLDLIFASGLLAQFDGTGEHVLGPVF
jgi:hypothetical protein